MSFDLSQTLDDLKSSVENTWSDVTSTGVPAAVAGVENYAAGILQSQAAADSSQATKAAQAIVNRPGPSSGVMKSISDAFNGVAQNAVFKQYGGVILIGIAGLLIVGMTVGRD